MKITFETKSGEKLANLLCEIDALIEDGTITVGFTGLSPDAAKFCNIFYQATSNRNEKDEFIIIDAGLHLN